MYDSLIFVDPDASISEQQVLDELLRFYTGKPASPAEIVLSADTVVLRWPSYTIEVGRSCKPHVAEESAQIAEEFGQTHPARQRIAQCKCRFELSGDEDPEMDHFNDALLVGEAIERLGKVYRFDQASAEFIE